MLPSPQTRRIAEVLAQHPQLAFDFYCAASEIVDDFEDYGPVLQANDVSAYDDTTAIIRLSDCRNRLIALLGDAAKS